MSHRNTELFSLGELYISDFLKAGTPPSKGKHDMTLVFDPDTRAVRLKSVVDPSLMYGEYWYRSGINATMRNELRAITEDCLAALPTAPGDIWLDIACNDGTLFKTVPSSLIKVGVDPADDSYANESRQVADLIIQDFFSAKAYQSSKYGKQKAKIITTIAMFYDIDEPLAFLQDVDEIMDDEGLFVLQMSYTPLMLKQLAFDNICHEHVYYYTLTSIKNLLDQVSMKIVDCQLNDVNGGSFRVYIRKNSADVTAFRTSPYRDVAQYRVESLLAKEKADKVDSPQPYLDFYHNIQRLWEETVNFIDAIAERNPTKYGLQTVGTNIPICSEHEMRAAQPDYLLVLPWHFISEFCEREKEYLSKGGKFIVPCPSFQIVEGRRND